MSEEKKNNKKSIQVKDVVILLLVLVLVGCGIYAVQYFGKQNQKNDFITVELDAAFGGETGATGILSASEYNEKVVNELESILKKDSNFKVLRTHAAGTSMNVSERAIQINEDQPDIVLCIRAEDDADVNVSGMRIYAEPPVEKNHTQSLALADAIRETFTTDTFTPAVGYYYYTPVKSNTFQIHFVDETDETDYGEDTLELMKQVEVPVVVSGGIYITNQTDVDTWATKDGYHTAAMNYYKALCNVYGKD